MHYMVNTDSFSNHINYLHQDKQCISFFTTIITLNIFIICVTILLAIYEIPPLIPFSINKYMPMSEIKSNSILVIAS